MTFSHYTDNRMGWICPKCQSVMSPLAVACYYCSAPVTAHNTIKSYKDILAQALVKPIESDNWININDELPDYGKDLFLKVDVLIDKEYISTLLTGYLSREGFCIYLPTMRFKVKCDKQDVSWNMWHQTDDDNIITHWKYA